ncbi:probable multidrug resistance-associated protein lethal(2)03659 [Drosophila kikkawai]|uniref:Probable multidrug resistance-associated protein lethal(2)03659 n=1 Tax=Drosophila kikkawai TaxID=30033 RepID=A0A6P4IIH6_DROKI|nr:probable multidrug resistance-associated protein lethal(2)03659 [Drosophila kikkawai]
MESKETEDLPENPRIRANFLSLLTFWYTMPTFIRGLRHNLDSKDLYKTMKEHKSEPLGNKLYASWERELKNSRGNPSLMRALLRVFGWQFGFFGLVLFLAEGGLRTLQPLLLLKLISHFAHGSESTKIAFFYAGALILSVGLNVICKHPCMYGIWNLCFKARVSLSSMIYRKSLRLSRTALGAATSGHVVNLISNDVSRLDNNIFHAHFLWIGPLQTVLVTYLMYLQIGISAVLGVAFMLLFIPLQMYLGKKTSELRLKTALRTDKRMRMMNEIISGIQVIKMYAWERPFERLVAHARQKEVNAICHGSYIKGILSSFTTFLSRASIFLSLVGYVLLGQLLTPEVAFMVTAYYNVLQTTMMVFFPQAITQTAEILATIGRVQKFMLSEEVKETVINDDPMEVRPKKTRDDAEDRLLTPSIYTIKNTAFSEPSISITGLKAKWDTNCPDYTLDGVDLRVQSGTMLAVLGSTGSGKSSLIQAILGEMSAESGEIKVNGTMSYAAQEPWLFSGTIRENILFNQPMDRKRYDKVVRQCALDRDFELLRLNDKTLVGERGASLSGGQRMRISLARAVYREASIYLLDDPLSAVDSHVAKHLFEQCMRGYLRDRIVVLITHQRQFLQRVDQIVIMDKGKVCAVGTYDSLLKAGLDFSTILSEPEGEGQMEELSELEEVRSRLGSLSQPHNEERCNSEKSLLSIMDSCMEKINVERQESGNIGLRLYKKYFKSGGGLLAFLVMITFFVVSRSLIALGDYFLVYWVGKKRNGALQESNDTLALDHTIQNTGWSMSTEQKDIWLFTLITVFSIITTVTASFLIFNLARKCSIGLHNSIFNAISRASMYFFNTNPPGRILNRFSKDLGQVDEMLPVVMMDVIQTFLCLTGIVIIIAVVNPLLLTPTFLISIIFYKLRTFYLKTSRDVKRIDAIARSPVYSHLASSLSGLTTIRAFQAQRIMEAEFDGYQDTHSSAFYMFLSTSRAYAYWLDFLCVIYIAVTTLSFFTFPPTNAANVGLVITQALGLTGLVQFAMRQSAELENLMTAVERVVEYEAIEPEGELEAPVDKKPPESWPGQGKIVFDELSLRYIPNPKTKCVLKSLNFVIKPREKVGIVGRTGAGKSSLINALFRLSYNEGSILIDTWNTNEMGLHDLRSKISIIPQEPVLFSGTMRYNLDPFDEYSDDKLWRILEEVKLRDVVAKMSTGLQTKITEGGSNFSVGQRQLVCLARAILRENRILVMDEATANVDPQTDGLIQATIRNKFKECTVLTIAHRLHTIMDSDKVLVMDAGRVVEFGTPFELLTMAESKVFHGMALQTGQATYDELLKIAEKCSLAYHI